MLRQRLDRRQRIVTRRQRLGLEPFVEHQRVARITVVEDVQRRLAQVAAAVHQRAERALPVGHVVRPLELAECQFRRVARAGRRDIAQCHVADPARSLGRRRIGIRRAAAVRFVKVAPALFQRAAEIGAQRLSRGIDRFRIDHAQLIANEAFGRQQHCFGDEGGVQRRVVQRVGHRVDHRAMVRAALHRARHQGIQHQLLHRLVARERIVIVPCQEGEVCRRPIAFDRHRGRKAAVDRQHRPLRDALEHDRLARLVEQHQLLRPQRLARFRAEQPDAQRQDHRLLARLSGRRRHMLRQPKRRPPALMIKARRHARRARLAVPQAKARQIDPAALFHARHEILAGRGGAVEAIEIQVARRPEPLRPQDGRHHANELGALVVDGRGVEVGDLDIAFGPHRMRQRAGILGKLAGAKPAHVLDPLDGSGALVGGKSLIAKDGEAFLQRKLEPVTAGDPVAGPIVEIFVRHDRGDGVIVVIGRGIGIGQDVAAVEDVQPLVLHRAEVEIVHRDDVEHVQVIFAAIDPLVPRHGGLQGVKRMIRLGQVGLAHPDAKLHLPARSRGERARIAGKIARHQREQIARLGKRIVPLGPVRAIIIVAACDRIAIRQQHRIARLVCGHPHAIGGQHVGSIREEGDPAKTLRLALGAQITARRIQAHQLCVPVGRDLHLGFDHMRVAGQRNDQLVILHPPVVHRHAVHRHGQRRQPVAVQLQRLAHRSVAQHLQPGANPRRARVQRKVERHVRHQPGRRAIVLAALDRRSGWGGENIEHE